MLDAGVQKIDGKTYTLEKPFYATVKRGAKEPTLAVKNGYLTVDNDLYTLSEGIRDDMKVEEGQARACQRNSKWEKTTAKHSKWLSLDHFLILIPILILVIILSIEKQSRERRKKRLKSAIIKSKIKPN